MTKCRILLTLTVSVNILQVSPMGFKRRFHQSFGGSLAALALSMSPALAEELQNWSFDTSSSELTFSLSDQIFPEFFLLSEPPRLVLDIPDAEIGNVDPEQIYNGAVRNIRVAQHTSENVRVVIELAPDIVLSPDQADIQFDDNGEGQRHWRFRPLIADGAADVTVATSTSRPNTGRTNSEISLSAANLKLPVEVPNSTALPIDPYDSESSNDVVSVPPLADDVVVAPPDVSEADASISVAVATDVPELPPMTVPELEETLGENGTAIPTVAVDEEVRRPSSLPELDASSHDNSQPNASEIVESVDVTPSQNSEEIVAAGDPGGALENVVSTAENPVEESVVVPIPDVEISVPAPTETALAPVESSVLPEKERAVDDDSDNLSPQPIQQPAAERTIMQTELPQPLTFGQPLPAER